MKPEVLVVGAGFAGLSAAIHLAAQGAEVTLVEQDDRPGGKAGEAVFDGFRFDTGPSVFTLPQVFEDVFAAAGRTCPVELEPLEHLCRYRFPSGRVWDVYRDVERTVAQLDPAEADAYVRLRETARRLYEAAAPTFVTGPPPRPIDLLRYGLRHGWRAYPFHDLRGLIRSHGAEGDLETFFLRFATYFGADPHRAPAVLHNIAWVELGLGIASPKGGIYAAVKALADLARDLGVTLRLRERVIDLQVEEGEITKVATDQATYRPRHVVSAIDRTRTRALVGDAQPVSGEPSLSGFVLLLGVQGHHDTLAQHTISFPADYRAEFADLRAGSLPRDPTLYLHLSCRRDPADAPAGAENWFVMANAPALPPASERSAGSASRVREAEERYADQLVERLSERGLLDPADIRVRRHRGPLDLERYGARGAIYGRAPHGLLATLRPGVTLPGVGNLTLAGGTVHPGGGIPLAILSGKQAARQVLGI